MRLFSFLALSPAAVYATVHNFSINNWQGFFNGASGVLQSLSPVADLSYDFSPTDYFHLRNGPGNYHTGDITMSWRLANSSEWQEVDSAASRQTSPIPSALNGSLLHSNFDNVFPAAAKYMSITRDWQDLDGDLLLSYTVANHPSSPSIEIGAFGLPLEFNNIFTNRTPEETHIKCNLIDPYIGLDAGYAQVTRLTGTGPNIVITPATNVSKFEAWNFLYENPDQPCEYQSNVFEGLYAWQTVSLAYAENQWNATDPWMPPTSQILHAGDSVTYALRFTVASQVADIESVAASNGLPVTVGIPGFIVPEDMDTFLYLNYEHSVKSMSVVPAGALSLSPATIPSSQWKAYAVKPGDSAFGRARLLIEYADGKQQAVSYYLINSGPQTVEKYAEFLFDEQWFTDDDPYFHRSPSVISYDYGTKSQILQEYRTWIAGISDEAGAGSFEAAAMKTSVYPVASQVHQLEEMVAKTVYNWLQNKHANGTENPANSVKRSLFYWQPDLLPPDYYNKSIPFADNYAWNQSNAWDTWRAYDYVHVSALYWGLYAAESQSPGVLQLQNQTWYLLRAYETVMEIWADYDGKTPVTYYGSDGLMCETVWLYILRALKAEGYTAQFDQMQARMQAREKYWSTQKIPYGSEMPWDSTGEEGVYLWAKYFNNTALVTQTLDAIRGYMPTVAHWGWNGCARRYWDFLYGGSIARVERMIHHYGSGLNALPLLDAYKYNPTPSNLSAIYDLRVAYGGNMGPMSNINDEGFGSEAFHSFPDTMIWEAYSSDYGQNFLGHILGACTYLVDHPDFGMVSFGGNILTPSYGGGASVSVQPMDTVRQRIYVAPAGLAVQINAGAIDSFTYDSSAKTVTVQLGMGSGQSAKSAIMTYEDTIGTGVAYASSAQAGKSGGYSVTLPSTLTFKI